VFTELLPGNALIKSVTIITAVITKKWCFPLIRNVLSGGWAYLGPEL
jgi:hypothetical protein